MGGKKKNYCLGTNAKPELCSKLSPLRPAMAQAQRARKQRFHYQADTAWPLGSQTGWAVLDSIATQATA